MFSPDCIEEIENAANMLDVEAAALLAVADIESGGKAFATIDGRREPLIRFEGHYFDRRLSGSRRTMAREAGLASPTPGAIPNPSGQAARWRMLTRAAAIDRKAAYESVSWGLGQVMGAHWAWLGYADVGALVAEARSGVAGQARLMGRFITRSGLAAALRDHDWTAFARGYNGPAFARNSYDSRLKKAYARYAGRGGTSLPDRILRAGDSGSVVQDLQDALERLGYDLRPDGVFGPETQAALKRFQADRGLSADGIAGRETLAALCEPYFPSHIASWLSPFKALLRWIAGR